MCLDQGSFPNSQINFMLNQEQKVFQQSINSYLSRKHDSPHDDITILEKIKIQELPRLFGTSTKNGLTESQVQKNQEQFGRNVYKKKKVKTLCQIFIGAITDEMLIILMIAAVISIVVQFFFGEDKSKFWVQGVSILVAVAICSTVATFNDYQKDQQFVQLDQLSDKTFKYEVVRQGQKKQLHRSEIVVGDIIKINSGMQIPTDSLLIESVDVIVDESQLTGQSHEVYKNTFEKCIPHKKQRYCPSPLMISGTSVSSGQGKIMAVIVGGQSQMGKFFDLIFDKDDDEEQSKTPLEERLQVLGGQIGYFGIYSAIVIFLILVIRLVVGDILYDGFDFGRDAGQIVTFLIIAVAIVVMAVPEGLPLAVTLTLAFSVKQMYDENNLVKKLISCETMGSVHYICTDKTGTITQNKMFVGEFINEDFFNIDENKKVKFHKDYQQLLTEAICHNSSSHTNPQKGSQTEIALLKFVQKQFNVKETSIREKAQVSGYFKRLPFNSNRKRMTTGVLIDGKNYLFMSGASQVLIQTCSSLLNSSTNQKGKLDKDRIHTQIQKMTKKGLRSVAIGYKIVDMMGESHYHERDVGEVQSIEKDGFTLLGVFGIEDKPRPQSREAIEKCREAGVNVIMVTGDNLNTAESISRQVSIISEDFNKSLEGPQFQKLLRQKGMIIEERKQEGQIKKTVKKVNLDSEEKISGFAEIVNGLAVLARSKPQHKYLLVDGLIQLNHVVAVTGDGTNDAPALVKADVGLSMGQSGTQVAKNASDIVILDDRFDSIVRSIVWGRNIYESIRKFLQFQLTVNFVAVVLSVLSAAIIRQSVLTAVQMLWVNLIMDSLASLALSTEPPRAEALLKQKPNQRDESLLTKTMIKHIVIQTIFQVSILMVLLFVGAQFLPEQKDAFDDVIGEDLEAKYYNGIAEGTMADGRFYTFQGQDAYKVYFDKYKVNSRHFTFIFNAFVFLQIFNFFCCRRINDEFNIFEGIFSTWLFWFVVIIIVVFQFIIIQFLGQFFKLYSYGGLTTQQWLISVGIGALTIPITMFIRLLPCCKPDRQPQHQKNQNN